MSNPEEVEAYLKSNPSFLVDRPALLAAMDLGDLAADDAFQQRNLDVMRARENVQRQRVEVMMENVESNQQLERMLHDLSVSLLASRSQEGDKVVKLGDQVGQYFGLGYVSLLLRVEAAQYEEDLEYKLLEQRVAHLSSICDDRVASKLLTAIFPNASEGIGSCAFVPLVANSQLIGVMVLGDLSAERFQPGMGSIILDRLGELVGACLG